MDCWRDVNVEEERRSVEGHHKLSLMTALRDPRVLALSAIYLMSVTANYGITFFMPQIVKGMGLSNLMTGFVSAVPYVIGMIGLVLWGWSSDRSNERRWHLIVASIVGCIGLVWAGWFGPSFVARVYSLPLSLNFPLAMRLATRPTTQPKN